MTHVIRPKLVLRVLLSTILFLLIANLAASIIWFVYGHDFAFGLVPLFDFDSEKNVPTFFSAVALLSASALLVTIAKLSRNSGVEYALWLVLAVIFLFLSIDEISSLHEKLIKPLRSLLGTSGVFYFAWIIPYASALGLLAIVYLRFLLRLPRETRNLFLLSAGIFVFGAIGFEMIGGWYFESIGPDNLTYQLITTCEEFLEMLGVAIFIYALLSYIADEFQTFSVTITND